MMIVGCVRMNGTVTLWIEEGALKVEAHEIKNTRDIRFFHVKNYKFENIAHFSLVNQCVQQFN